MLLVKIKLKLMAVHNINRQAKRKFSIELKNKFAALAALEDEAEQDSVEC